MSFKHSCDITVENPHSISPDVFTVAVQSHFLFFSKPHAVVIPKLFAGRLTSERGFMIEFTRSDSETLMFWHDILSEEVLGGKYREMMARARAGVFPVEFCDEDQEIAPTIKGFRAAAS